MKIKRESMEKEIEIRPDQYIIDESTVKTFNDDGSVQTEKFNHVVSMNKNYVTYSLSRKNVNPLISIEDILATIGPPEDSYE